MNIIRWEPFGEMVSLGNAMDRLFEDSFVKWARPLDGGTYMPAVDIFDTPEKLGIRASLPGIKPEDINISVTSEGMVIKGDTRDEREIKEENYVRRECHYGTFARTIALPQGLKIDKAEAVMENGVLTLEIPKSEKEKPKTVKIRAKAEPEKLKVKETKEVKS